MRKARLNLVYEAIPHHGRHSGYDQLAGSIAALAPANLIRFSGREPGQLSRWLSRKSRMEWYEPRFVELERRTAARLFAASNQICHILYGEDVYCYLRFLRGFHRSRGGRLVATYHQPPSILERVLPDRGALQSLDAAIAVGSSQLPFLQSALSEDRVFLVPHGVDTDFFSPSDGPRSHNFSCLFVGQWLRDFPALRGVITAITGARTDVGFTVLTTKEQGEDLKDLPQTTVLSGISDDEMLALYRGADLLILPLLDSTANNSILEAMSCGIPVVTSDVGSVRDYLTPRSGVFLPAGDVAAFTEVTLGLLRQCDERLAMGEAARKRALDFDWTVIASRMISIFDHVSAS